MKLFFDENLSSTLVQHLSQQYPMSSHVRDAQLVGRADNRIWDYCKEHDFIIVSKDTDFRERSFTEGFPPKVIWLDVGNAGTITIANLLRQKHRRVVRFATQPNTSLLILSMSGDAI
ncbi:MAG TPA: DUF5615 family PIN-like protein [Fodinibius sp.]|nr:DUF5615 family PIN-like protein [Fodinibius sp.]